VNFTPTRIIPGEKRPRADLDALGEEKNFFPPAGKRNMISLTSSKQPRHCIDYVVPTTFLYSSLIIRFHERVSNCLCL